MIGPLHEDVWGVVVQHSSGAAAVMPFVCTRLRVIVYNYYVDLIGPVNSGGRGFIYSDHTCFVRKVHKCDEYDMKVKNITPTLLHFLVDIHECDACANYNRNSHISQTDEAPPLFSPAILKIAAGMTQLNTTWRIDWPEK